MAETDRAKNKVQEPDSCSSSLFLLFQCIVCQFFISHVLPSSLLSPVEEEKFWEFVLFDHHI